MKVLDKLTTRERYLGILFLAALILACYLGYLHRKEVNRNEKAKVQVIDTKLDKNKTDQRKITEAKTAIMDTLSKSIHSKAKKASNLNKTRNERTVIVRDTTLEFMARYIAR